MLDHDSILHDALLWLLAAAPVGWVLAGTEFTSAMVVSMAASWANLNLLKAFAGGLVRDARVGRKGPWAMLVVGKAAPMAGLLFFLMSILRVDAVLLGYGAALAAVFVRTLLSSLARDAGRMEF